MRKHFILIFCFCLSLLLIGCNSTEISESQIVKKEVKTEAVTKLVINGNLKMENGSTQDLSVDLLPSSLKDTTVEWSTSDPLILSVNDGKVSANDIGVATITAKAGNITSSISIVVVEKLVNPTEISLVYNNTVYKNGDSIELTELDEKKLEFTYTPSVNVLEGLYVTVVNGDSAYIKDNDTLVCSKAGKVELLAYSKYDSNVKLKININIKEKHFVPERIEISGDASVESGTEAKYSATVYPARALQDVTWSTSNEAIATINDKGNVVGIAPGKVKILATSKETSEVVGEFDLEVTPELFDRSKIYVNKAYTKTGEEVKVGDVTLVVGKNAYSTIAKAMSAVKPGGEIILASGQYDEALTIVKPCSIVGPNKDVKGNGTRVDEAMISKLIHVVCDDVSLIGLGMEKAASIKVKGNNCNVINCKISTTPIQCNGFNRCACIVDSKDNGNNVYVTNLVVKGCYINVVGSQWGYLTNYMSFGFIDGLTVEDNFITNEGTTAGTSGEGLMIYYARGQYIIKNNEFNFATTSKLVSFTNQKNESTLIEFSGNVIRGRGEYTTAMIQLQNAKSTCEIKIVGNEFYNVVGETISLGSSPTSGLKVTIAYNYFDSTVTFKMAKKTTNTTFNYNCYMAPVDTATVGADDATKYKSLQEVKAAYQASLAN